MPRNENIPEIKPEAINQELIVTVYRIYSFDTWVDKLKILFSHFSDHLVINDELEVFLDFTFYKAALLDSLFSF